MKNILKEELEIDEEGILIINEEEIPVKCVKSDPNHEYEGGCKLCVKFNITKRCIEPFCCAHHRKDKTNVHFIKIIPTKKKPSTMATKFISLDNPQPVKKQTKFTHYLNISRTVKETLTDNPSKWNNVLHIGTDKYYGDVFKVWDNGEENNFTIFFGEKGDEFE